MKWRTPEISMKRLSGRSEQHTKPPDKNTSSGKKHERPRRPGYNSRQAIDDNSSEDILSNDDEEENEVYRKISERRSELNRARRNGDDCHVSWYPVSGESTLVRSAPRAEPDENAIVLLSHDHLVAVCNGKSSSIERARSKRSSKVWQYELFYVNMLSNFWNFPQQKYWCKKFGFFKKSKSYLVQFNCSKKSFGNVSL